jgi:hypothetical protein
MFKRLSKLIRRRDRGKEQSMAEKKDDAAGLSKADVEQIVSDALGKSLKTVTDAVTSISGTVGDLAKNQKVLADTMAAQAAPKPEEKKEGEQKPLTIEDVGKAISDALGKQQQTQQQQQARGEFISKNLAKLPARFQQALGNDPAKWADEAKTIQGEYEQLVKSVGGKLENVGGADRDGGTTPAKQQLDASTAAKLPNEEFAKRFLPRPPGSPVEPEQQNTGAGAAAATA